MAKLYFVEKIWGIASLPDCYAAPKVIAGILEKVELGNYEVSPTKVYAMHTKGDRETQKNKLFIDFLLNNFDSQIKKLELSKQPFPIF